jgi:hypothetical protein
MMFCLLCDTTISGYRVLDVGVLRVSSSSRPRFESNASSTCNEFPCLISRID